MQTDNLFTRQQVTEKTGIPDEVLAFWIKNGLIVPSSGGQGRGSHRRFDWVQVSIAAVLQQLRRFGSNIATLKSFAELLQRAGRLDAIFGMVDPQNYVSAISIAMDLAKLTAEGSIELDDWEAYLSQPDRDIRRRGGEPKPKKTITEAAELFGYHCNVGNIRDVSAHDGRDGTEDEIRAAIIDIAQKLEPEDYLPLRLYDMLVSEIRTRNIADNFAWLVYLDDAGNWHVHTSVASTDFGLYGEAGSGLESAIYISVSAINRRLWGQDLALIAAENRADQARAREAHLANLEASEKPEDQKEGRRLRRIYEGHWE